MYYCPGGESKKVDEAIDKIAKEVGEIDIVVANAGMFSLVKDWLRTRSS